jgi:hypothetical protein
VAGSCEHDKKTGGEFPDQMSDYHLLKKGSALWS